MPSTLLQKIKSLVGSFNLVGEEPNFKIQGFSRVPSACSILLSAVGIAFIGFISYIFLAESFDVTKPDVNIELRTLPNYPKISMAKEKIFFAIMRNNLLERTHKIEWPAMETITAEVTLKTFKKDQDGNASGLKFEKFRLEAVNCSTVRDQYDYLDNHTVAKSVRETGICFVPKEGELDDYYLQGQRLEDIYSSFKITVWPCSLKNPLKCGPPQLVSLGRYVLIMPSPDVDLSKPDNFLKSVALASDVHEIDLGSRQQMFFKLKKFSIFDKTSMFREAKHRRDYFQIDESYVKSLSRNPSRVYCPAQAIGDTVACQPYLEMIFTSSNKQETITRLYPSLFRALSEIGGFTELIMMSIGFIYGLYNAWFSEMRTFLVRSVFARGEKTSACASDKKGYGKVVEDNLDIVEVMKELNGLRILNRVIFKEHHLTLLPEVLSKIKDEESKEDEKKEKGKEMAKNHNSLRNSSNNKISPLQSKQSFRPPFLIYHLIPVFSLN